MADLGLCLGLSSSIFLMRHFGALEGSHVKCTELSELGERAYVSKNHQDQKSSCKMWPALGL